MADRRHALTVLHGQPDVYSTSFQTRQLVGALEPWFDATFIRLSGSRRAAMRHLERVWVNYARPLVTRPQVEHLLYANDGAADLRHWRGRRILYWYDAPWDWHARPPSPRQLVHWVRYRNLLAADQVFAVSAAQVRVARALRQGREDSVAYLPVGVDCATFAPERANAARVRQAFEIPRKPTIGYLGYLGTWNGRFAGEVLLEAAPALLAKHDVHFLVVGFGPALPLWKSRVAKLGLSGRFTFTGFVADELVPDAIAAMDVCVDTLEEGFHSEARSETKLKQYMAMGRACVATAIGENRVDLEDGRCGVLVEPGARALLAGLCALCERPERAAELGRAARERARQSYDWRILADRFARVVIAPPN